MDDGFGGLSNSLDDVDIDEAIKEEVAKEFGVPKKVLDKVKVKYGHLPYIGYLEKIGKRVYRRIGKILGAYNPRLEEIYIDTGLKLRNLFNSEALRKSIGVKAEEFSHAAQQYLGRLKPKNFWDYLRNYHRDKNEIEAKGVANKVTPKIIGKYFGGGSMALYQ